MSGIQQEYLDRIQSLSPKERVARSVAIFNWSREIVGRQILRVSGSTDPERLKWLVAMRQYGSDPRMRTMIQRILDRVSS